MRGYQANEMVEPLEHRIASLEAEVERLQGYERAWKRVLEVAELAGRVDYETLKGIYEDAARFRAR